jgi:RNA polymerase sigma-70 factor (ECF subfamily)
LRALKNWPEKGPPRDTVAWLIFVGRNFGVDQTRKVKKQTELPDEDKLSDLDDREADMAERLDNSLATTCCGCCSSAAIPTCR